MRVWLAAGGLTAGMIIAVSAAGATITPTTAATDLAAAITSDPSFVTGASFLTQPPRGSPNAVSTTPLARFPTDGGSYAILTTGDASAAASPNTNVPDDLGPDDDQTAADGGGSFNGDGTADVTVLEIDLKVPAGDNCLSIDFRFLSEEYPEYVGQSFNDAFIAELDTNSWRSDSDINAPNNFAFASGGVPISVNATGSPSVSPANAAGTTYDAATALLSASTPVTPGAHALYLSIFDQGDDVLDSAVFVDNLVLGQVAGGGCKKGATTRAGGGGGQPTGTATGTVTVGSQSFTGGPVPYDRPIDVTNGTLQLTTRAGTLLVYGGGVFSQFMLLKSSENGKPLDVLKLTGGNFGICKSGFRTASTVATQSPPKTVRRLFARGKGSFQTRGNYSAATVRGTFWLTADRCDGTFTQTRQGVVEVFDFKKKKRVRVPAGKTYLALRP